MTRRMARRWGSPARGGLRRAPRARRPRKRKRKRKRNVESRRRRRKRPRTYAGRVRVVRVRTVAARLPRRRRGGVFGLERADDGVAQAGYEKAFLVRGYPALRARRGERNKVRGYPGDAFRFRKSIWIPEIRKRETKGNGNERVTRGDGHARSIGDRAALSIWRERGVRLAAAARGHAWVFSRGRRAPPAPARRLRRAAPRSGRGRRRRVCSRRGGEEAGREALRRFFADAKPKPTRNGAPSRSSPAAGKPRRRAAASRARRGRRFV